MTDSYSVNRRAVRIVTGMLADADALGLGVLRLANGATVIDCGVEAAGSLEAGKLAAEVSMGGLGQVDLLPLSYPATPQGPGFWLPGVAVHAKRTPIACMVVQGASWRVTQGDFAAMGSGPARTLCPDDELMARLAYLGYRDQAEGAVLLLEGRRLPHEAVAGAVAGRCGIDPANLYLLVAPTASLVGSVQIAARVVETALHKLMTLGFDLRQVVAGYGTCPLAPVAADDREAMGRTNDAVLFGGQVYLAVRAEDEDLRALLPQIPSSASHDYGFSFGQLLARYHDFYAIDPLLFSPAEITLNNLASGRTFHAGWVNADLLRASLLSEGN